MKKNLRLAVLTFLSAALLLAGCSRTLFESGDVTGTPVEQGLYPWMASTQFDGKAICGGALIAPTWVLTAKHCHDTGPTQDPDTWQVRVGSTDRKQGGELLAAKRFVDYPDDEVDLALIELTDPSKYEPVQVLAPDITAPYEPGSVAITMGWGTNGETLKATEMLDWNLQQTSGNETCGGGENGVFCGGRPGGAGSGTCSFDSGGPYVWAADQFDAQGAPRSTPYIAGTLRGLNNESCGVAGQDDDWQMTGGEFGNWIREQIQ